MLDTKFAKSFQHFFIDPVTQKLAGKVSANTLTFVGLLFGLLVMPLSYLGYTIFAILSLISSGLMDIADGSLARHTRPNPKGAVFDIVSDRAVEASVILSLFFIHPDHAFACLIMLTSILLCVSSFLVVGIFLQNQSQKSFHYHPGLIERSEAFLFFIAMFLYPDYFLLISSFFSLLVISTTIFRLYQFAKAQNS